MPLNGGRIGRRGCFALEHERSRVRRRWVRWFLLGLAAVALLAMAVVVFWPPWLIPLPSPAEVRQRALAPTSLILDRQGRVLYEIVAPQAGLHRLTPLDELPLALRQAIVATEDATFYTNPGVNLRAIARAAWLNLRSGAIVSGGSTITQQLARNLLMTAQERGQRSLWRKAREGLLAYHITRTLSKDEILELYLNETYFGNMAYGAESAARAYFGKPARELDLAECALLAGLPQSPSLYNPLEDLPAAQARQQVVLSLMVKAGRISSSEADLAAREPLHFAAEPMEIEAPHFCMAVRGEASRLLGEEALRRGGLRIRTTLDLDLQRAAEAQLRRQLAALNTPTAALPSHNARNGAVLVLDPRTGDVLAMVGSPDYFSVEIDGALNAVYALRQPGSALKPLTYAAAFERGQAPASVLSDVRTAFTTREGEPYVPLNYDRVFHGPVSLRQALGSSYNVVAVKVLDRIGIDALPDMAHRLGITSLVDADRFGLALTLGGVEVRLWQLTRAYAILANEGRWVEPRMIASVQDADGHTLYVASPVPQRQALDPRIAYLVTDVLADPEARAPGFGGATALELPFAAAVKTGTTSEWRDNWTVGYTHERVVGVWVGNADNASMVDVTGVSGAAPIWNGVMRAAQPPDPAPFSEPQGLVHVRVCPESGLLPTSACPHIREELFLAGQAPTVHCAMHQWVTLDVATGAPASAATPPERRVSRRIVVWPAEAQPWARQNGLLEDTPSGGQETSGRVEANAQPPGSSETSGRPELWLAAPDPNAVFALSPSIPLQSQRIEVLALADSSLALQSVELWVDGRAWHSWASPPYRAWWPLAAGQHTFEVVGVDAVRGRLTSPPIRVSVRLEAR